MEDLDYLPPHRNVFSVHDSTDHSFCPLSTAYSFWKSGIPNTRKQTRVYSHKKITYLLTSYAEC